MKYLLIFVLSSSILFAIGCGKKDDKSSTDGDKKEQTDSKKNDSKDDKFELKTNDLWIASGIPDNYPKEIPQPKDAKVQGYLSSKDGTVVTFEGTGDFKSIVNKFKEDMKSSGYDLSDGGEVLMSDKFSMMMWKKGEKEVSFTATLGEDGKSAFLVTYK